MDYESVVEKLTKGNEIKINDLLKISDFLVNSNYDNLEICTICYKYEDYLIKFYEGDNDTINNQLTSIWIKSHNTNVYNWQMTHFNQIKCSEKQKYFLESFLEVTKIKNFMVKLEVVSRVLAVIDDVSSASNLFKKYSHYLMDNVEFSKLIKIGAYEILDHLLKINKSRNWQENEILRCLIDQKFQINNETIYKLAQCSNNTDPCIDIIYDEIFANYMFNENEIQILLASVNRNLLKWIFLNHKTKDNELDISSFIFLIRDNNYMILLDYLQKGKVKNLKINFEIFWSHIQKNHVNYVQQADIYKVFVNCLNIDCNDNLDFFFKKRWYTTCSYLIKEKNIITNNKNFESYISNSPDQKLFEEYFFQLKCDESHLRLACLYNTRDIIISILNRKIIPTQKCYDSLFEICSVPISIPDIVELLIASGYQMTDQDIITAAKKQIKLYDNMFTREFKPTKEFYDHCTPYFHPEYNDEMYKDNYWIKKWCKIATTGKEFIKIKQLAKKHKLEFDGECKIILENNCSKNKAKEDLINMCIH